MPSSKVKTSEPKSDILYMRNLLGVHLRQARDGAGFSIRKLEEFSGVSNSEISRVENGSQECRLESFVRICAALGIPCGQILDQVVFGQPQLYEEKIAAQPAVVKLLDRLKELGPLYLANMGIIASFAAHLIRCNRPADMARAVDYPDEGLRTVFLKFADLVELVRTPGDRLKLLELLRDNPLAVLMHYGLCDSEVVTRTLKALAEGNSVADSESRKTILAAAKVRSDLPVWLPFVSSLAALEVPEAEKGGKSVLDSTSLKSNYGDVKSELEKLIARVKRLVTRQGAKTELARFLDVAPARITEWLSDDAKNRKEPGGYYALELLKWVEQQERKT